MLLKSLRTMEVRGLSARSSPSWRLGALALFMGAAFLAESTKADAVTLVPAPVPVKTQFNPQQFFESVKGLVFPLKTAMQPGDPKKSYGTAFVVDSSGILATNFHVISEVVRDPGKYNLYLDLPGSDDKGSAISVSAEILAFDIVHDLALVKVERAFGGAFVLPGESDPIPSAAERIWSLGKPLDLSMALVEGNFNGELAIGDFSKFFISTPINPGMSGGPTVDSSGVVRGINYAILLKTQNVSFAVPARHLVRLLADWRSGKFKAAGDLPPGPTERRALFRKWIETQLADAGGKMVDQFVSATSADQGTQSIQKAGVKLATFPAELKCWQDQIKKEAVGARPSLHDFLKGHSEEDEVASGSEMTLTLTSCHTGFSVELADGLDAGDLKFGMVLMEPGRQLVTPRDWRLYGSRIGSLSEKLLDEYVDARLGRGNLGREGEVCRRTPVRNAAGTELELSFCVDRYRNHPQLLDSAVRISGALGTGEAMVFVMQARGFRLDDLRRLTSHLLEGVRMEAVPETRPEGGLSGARAPASVIDSQAPKPQGGE